MYIHTDYFECKWNLLQWKDRVPECKQQQQQQNKKDLSISCLEGTHFKCKDPYRLKMKAQRYQMQMEATESRDSYTGIRQNTLKWRL